MRKREKYRALVANPIEAFSDVCVQDMYGRRYCEEPTAARSPALSWESGSQGAWNRGARELGRCSGPSAAAVPTSDLEDMFIYLQVLQCSSDVMLKSQSHLSHGEPKPWTCLKVCNITIRKETLQVQVGRVV